MFEEYTYEYILERMLSEIPDTFDKREGSIIYDSLSPVAIELNNTYLALDSMLQETFGDTATREYLIRLCAERGISPYEATKATLQATITPSTLEISTGARFNSDVSSYVVTEKISDGVYKLECEEAGTVGNEYLGEILPIDYISGLQTAEITSILIYGEDEESTEELRARYLESFNAKTFGGNKADYKEKTLAISGIGAVKVEPTWDGAGTVRLTILDSAYGIPTSALIALVQETFDPDADGEGNGLAPIGHVVTVRGALSESVVVTITITWDDEYSWDTSTSQVEAAIEAYLLELREAWEDESSAQLVRIAQIESRVLAVEGVLDVADTTINGVAANLTLDDAYTVPIFGGVSG